MNQQNLHFFQYAQSEPDANCFGSLDLSLFRLVDIPQAKPEVNLDILTFQFDRIWQRLLGFKA